MRQITADVLRVWRSKQDYINDPNAIKPRQFGATLDTGEIVRRSPSGDIDFIGNYDDSEVRGAITGIETDIDNIKIDIDNIETDISEIVTDIADIETEVARLDTDKQDALNRSVALDGKVIGSVQDTGGDLLIETSVDLAIADVDGLEGALNSKSHVDHLHDDKYSQLGHEHAIVDIVNLEATLTTLAQADAAIIQRVVSLETLTGTHTTQIGNLVNRVVNIEVLIPPQAGANNQLADKNFVNSSLTSLNAHRVSYTAAGDGFPSRALFNAAVLTGALWHNGKLWTPTEHDYVIILADEAAPAPWTGGQTRLEFDGSVWAWAYGINNRPRTAAEEASIQSGMTETLRLAYSAHIADSVIHITGAERTTWNAKQNALNRSVALTGKVTGSVQDTGGALSIATSVSLAEGDIPALAISKITDLQGALDSKISRHGDTMSNGARLGFAPSSAFIVGGDTPARPARIDGDRLNISVPNALDIILATPAAGCAGQSTRMRVWGRLEVESNLMVSGNLHLPLAPGALAISEAGSGQVVSHALLPINLGGTNAATAAAARTNLGVAYGTTAGTVCEGNDSRLSNSRAPIAHNHHADNINDGVLGAARIPNLDMSKITSGVLPIAQGGTGSGAAHNPAANLFPWGTTLGHIAGFGWGPGGVLVSATMTRDELLSNTAELNHNHAAGDINSGTLPLARGGTGGTSAQTAVGSLFPNNNTSPGFVAVFDSGYANPGYRSRNDFKNDLGSFPPSGAAGGDLRGSYPNPNVNQVRPANLSGANVHDVIYAQMADNDQFRLRVGGTASNAGYVEFATSDDGSEPIHFSQYDSGVFGRLVRRATILDENGYTQLPSYIQPWHGQNKASESPASNSHIIYMNGGTNNYLRNFQPGADRVVSTNANGAIIGRTPADMRAFIGGFGSAANTFCQGNDSRLSNARTPLAHNHHGWERFNVPALGSYSYYDVYVLYNQQLNIKYLIGVMSPTSDVSRNNHITLAFPVSVRSNMTFVFMAGGDWHESVLEIRYHPLDNMLRTGSHVMYSGNTYRFAFMYT